MLEQIALHFNKACFLYHVSQKRFTYLNPSFQNVWGQPSQKYLDAPALLLDDVHPEDVGYVKSNYQSVVIDKIPVVAEFRILVGQDQIRWINLAALLVEEEGERYLAGYAEDITKSKVYLNTLLKYSAKKNSTLEVLSHDLAAPFANIIGLVDLLERRGQRDNPQVMQLLNHISNDAQRGTHLIQAFVTNAFLESSKVEIQKIRTDIVQRVKEVMASYQEGERLIEKQFELVAPSEPHYIFIDDVKFLQVINNLVSNAIKFTHGNGTITVTVEKRGTQTYFSVADNGIGIPEEHKPILFEKFTKARRPGIRGEQPVGMGMSIIRNIVELHNGKIWFESTEGVGSVFHVLIPNE